MRGDAFTPVANRGMITISIMLANIMQGLDNTILNVALPHIQGSLSASLDQVAWTLTSYIVCSAIMMPLTDWLAGRFGIKPIFLASIIGFTIASALCGAATSLGQLVAFRALQGSLAPASSRCRQRGTDMSDNRSGDQDGIDSGLEAAKDLAGRAQTAATRASSAIRDAAITAGNQAGEAASKAYQQGSQAADYVSRNTAEQPFLALLIAAAVGYGIAYTIHALGRSRSSAHNR